MGFWATPAGGAIAKGAIGLIGGLFGRKKSKGVNFVQLRDSALAAGFNPLTALKANGGAGFETGGEMTALGFAANALNDGFETWYNIQSQEADRELQDLQKRILQAELAEYESANEMPRSGQFDIPSVVTYADEVTQEPPALQPLRFNIRGNAPRTMDDTGIYGADVGMPREFEADAWQWALDGTLQENFQEVFNRNVPKGHDSWSEFFWGSEEKGFLGNRAIRRAIADAFNPGVAQRSHAPDREDLLTHGHYRPFFWGY